MIVINDTMVDTMVHTMVMVHGTTYVRTSFYILLLVSYEQYALLLKCTVYLES